MISQSPQAGPTTPNGGRDGRCRLAWWTLAIALFGGGIMRCDLDRGHGMEGRRALVFPDEPGGGSDSALASGGDGDEPGISQIPV